MVKIFEIKIQNKMNEYESIGSKINLNKLKIEKWTKLMRSTSTRSSTNSPIKTLNRPNSSKPKYVLSVSSPARSSYPNRCFSNSRPQSKSAVHSSLIPGDIHGQFSDLIKLF
jgi:hypothetical protein